MLETVTFKLRTEKKEACGSATAADQVEFAAFCPRKANLLRAWEGF